MAVSQLPAAAYNAQRSRRSSFILIRNASHIGWPSLCLRVGLEVALRICVKPCLTSFVTTAFRCIVGVLLLGAASPLAGPMQSGSVQTGRLDPRIGAAAPQRYRSVRDAKDWENPYLVIRPDGIEVIVKRRPSARQTVAAAAPADVDWTARNRLALREGGCGARNQHSSG